MPLAMRQLHASHAKLNVDYALPLCHLAAIATPATRGETQMSTPNGRVLPDLTAQNEKIAALEAMIAKLMAERNAPQGLTLKINNQPWLNKKTNKTMPATNSLSLWGLSGPKPITLKAAGWRALSEFMPKVLEFIEAHEDEID